MLNYKGVCLSTDTPSQLSPETVQWYSALLAKSLNEPQDLLNYNSQTTRNPSLAIDSSTRLLFSCISA
jgi:hypothetical protein